MNFDLSDEQVVVRDLAEQIFAGHASPDRVKAVERSGGFDHALWATLADANLLGLGLPESVGGSGYGMVELALVLEQQGRVTAPAPVLSTVTAAMALARFGGEPGAATASGVIGGDAVLTTALSETGANDALRPSVVATLDPTGYRLTGFKPAVPFAQHANRILVPAKVAGEHASEHAGEHGVENGAFLFVVDPSAPGTALDPVITTNHEPQAHVTLDDASVRAEGRFGDDAALRWLHERVVTGLCALQVGVCEAALTRTAEYVTERHQFGRPLAMFQAVAQQAADAYVAVEAMRVTMLQAAWRLDEGLDAAREVLIAKYWASEAGQRVVHIAQHLHGGMGADIDYPIHRHFLWGIQIDTALGGASQQLARLGHYIAKG